MDTDEDGSLLYLYSCLVKPIVEAYGGEYLVRTDVVESFGS